MAWNGLGRWGLVLWGLREGKGVLTNSRQHGGARSPPLQSHVERILGPPFPPHPTFGLDTCLLAIPNLSLLSVFYDPCVRIRASLFYVRRTDVGGLIPVLV